MPSGGAVFAYTVPFPLRKSGKQKSCSLFGNGSRKIHRKYCIVCCFLLYFFLTKTANKCSCQMTDIHITEYRYSAFFAQSSIRKWVRIPRKAVTVFSRQRGSFATGRIPGKVTPEALEKSRIEPAIAGCAGFPGQAVSQDTCLYSLLSAGAPTSADFRRVVVWQNTPGNPACTVRGCAAADSGFLRCAMALQRAGSARFVYQSFAAPLFSAFCQNFI